MKRLGKLAVATVAVAIFGFAATQALGGPSAGILNSARDLPILQGPTPSDASARAQRPALQALLDAAPADSALAAADLSDAHPVAAPGGAAVWLAPTTEGGLCVFIPQPGPGALRFASACSTLTELNSTGSVSAVPDADGNALVVVVEPDGVNAPTLVGADGHAQQLTPRQNVVVATAAPGDRLQVAGVELEVPRR